MVSIIMGSFDLVASDHTQKKLSLWQELFQTQVPILFTMTELTWWKAIPSKWCNVVVTFVWSFMDLFIMLISVGLASQFKQINSDLRPIKGRVNNTKFHFTTDIIKCYLSMFVI